MIQLQQIQNKARSEGVDAHLALKEQIHFLILDYLFQKGVFSELVFQGGTALRMVYQGIRYSEDLDFVVKQKGGTIFKKLSVLLEGLPSHFQRSVLFVPSAQLKIQKESPTFKRYVLILKIENWPAQDKTNLEVVQVPSYENETKMLRTGEIPLQPAVCVETAREILSDKLCAFGSREYVKGRDLWDIFYLVETLGLKSDEWVKRTAAKKIADYGFTRKEFYVRFQENLSVLRKKGAEILKTEMERFLPLAYRRIYQNQYENICREVEQILVAFSLKGEAP